MSDKTAHGNSGGKLDRLLAYHEQAAAAIRLTIGLLNGQDTAAKRNGHATVLAQALALDGARAAKAKKKKPASTRVDVTAQRARSAQILEAFDTKTPRTAAVVQNSRAIAPLLRTGYLRKKRGGYLRTKKAFVVNLAEA